MVCCLIGSGCLATKYKIVRQSLTPIPLDAKGWLYVCDNTPIRVGVEGTEIVSREDVGGYYLLHKRDLAALMQVLKKEKK